MKKCLLLLFALFSIGSLRGMSCGEWISLSGGLREKAKISALTIKQANTNLGAEAQSRNVLTLHLSDGQEIVLFSGVSPFKQFSTIENEKYFSFIDILIGKGNSNNFFKMANESKQIIENFQKQFKVLKASLSKVSAKEKVFFNFIKTLGINEETSLVKLGECATILKEQVSPSMKDWNILLERIKIYSANEPLHRSARDAVIQYVEALGKYLAFLRELPCLDKEEDTLQKAISQTEFLKKVLPYVVDEHLIDVISENSNYIALFTHTETILAYLMFSEDIQTEISVYKKQLIELFEKGEFLMFSHRDMCLVCETVWSFFANKNRKQVIMLSNKEHENSHLRHNKSSLLKKVPLGSDMHMAWKTVKRDPADKKWREIFMYNFSPRMISLLEVSPQLKDIIQPNILLIPDDSNMAKDVFLFDRLINESSIIIRASEIYNSCIREYFFDQKESLAISSYARPEFLIELPDKIRAFLNQ